MAEMQSLKLLIRFECTYRRVLALAGPAYRDSRRNRRLFLIAFDQAIRFDLPYIK